ncbi:MAG: hypothetical protein LBO74_03495 [Candidatus Symbiothrix sp.]|jgi:hypothetical protein|nr:hypothetical protein [Candidatus Symbiothrix sp.]
MQFKKQAMYIVCTLSFFGAIVMNKAFSQEIYHNGSYIWQSDRIMQGAFTAKADSPTQITSNYRSPLDENKTQTKTWSLKNDISDCPHYESDFVLENAIYNMGLDEMIQAVEANLTLRTGEFWSGIWTRDACYSIVLAMASMQPTVAKNCLLHRVNSLGRIIQDTGTGGSWPCSSDRVIWITAAWEIYKVTGDFDWIRTIYPVVKGSVEDDIATIYDYETGLAMGESSFIDWREQSYPAWMQPVDIYKSKCLGTNALHYHALWIAGRMADIVGKKEDGERFQAKAEDLKKAINTHLWMPDKGFYAQYLYGRNGTILSPRSETLGEALCILFDIASPEQQQIITQRMPLTPFGPTIFYPQIPDIPSYHNNAVWPFVTSFWTWASAKTENGKAVLHGIGSVYRALGLFATDKENFVAENGDWAGTELNSNVMLWSISGNLSLVHRVLFGMNYEEDKIVFKPVVPKTLKAKRKLAGFRYRNAIFNLEIEGYGSKIQSFTLDNYETDALLPSDLTGVHQVKIVLANNPVEEKPIHPVENKFSLAAPETVLSHDSLRWQPVKGAISYKILKNGKEWTTQQKSFLKLKPGNEGEYQVIALNKDPEAASFASEPVIWSKINTIDLKGLRISKAENTTITVPIQIAESGYYAFDWQYANGNGPDPYNDRCAVRSFLIDGQLFGASVFPYREMGKDKTVSWDDRNWSNSIQVKLEPGNPIVSLEFRKENENMNITTNDAVLYQLRILKME